jgi:hypothetical protein
MSKIQPSQIATVASTIGTGITSGSKYPRSRRMTPATIIVGSFKLAKINLSYCYTRLLHAANSARGAAAPTDLHEAPATRSHHRRSSKSVVGCSPKTGKAFFAEGGIDTKPMIKRYNRSQGVLGDHQDTVVASAALRQMAAVAWMCYRCG